MVIGKSLIIKSGKQILEEAEKEKKKKKKEEKPFLEPTLSPEPKPPKEIKEPQVFRDEQGNITGIIKDGKALFGFDNQEARDYIEKRRLRLSTPEGAVEVKDVAAVRKGEKLAGQVGQFTPEQLAQIKSAEPQVSIAENRQAALSGLRNIIPGAISTAGSGAIAGGVSGGAGGAGGVGGASIGLGTGAGIGAAIGAVEGFYSGYVGNLQAQVSGEVSASTQVLRKGEQDLRRITSAAWSGRGDPVLLTNSFNQRLADIEKEHSKLYQETNSDLNLFLSQDGTVALQRYNEFFTIGGSRELLIDEFRTALISPTNEERANSLLNVAEDLE